MLFQECFNFFKRAIIRCDCSSTSLNHVKKESDQLILGYEVVLHKETKFCTINVKSKRIRTITGIRGNVESRGEDSIEVGNSCNGLILILYCRKHVLFDPLLNKIVAGTRRLPEWGGRCCGLFYHPLAKEYRLLLVKEIGDSRKEYHIYEFGSHKWRTTLSPYFAYQPVTCAPTVTKKVMCWFDPLSPCTSILVFDINTENLCSEALPPTAQNLSVPKLVAKGGEDLCCCYVRYAETVVDVWVLVDYTDWLWERKYAVNFDWEKNRCPSEAWSAHAPLVTRVTKVVSVQDNLLVLGFGGGELRCYDLGSNASWIVDTSKFDGKKRTTWYGRRVDKDKRWYGLVGL